MTVSRVVNGTGRVQEATRSRVNAAIAELGYQPNQVARGLTTRRSLTFGIVVPDITNPFFPGVVRGAEDAAWDAGYTVSLANAVEDPDRERAAITNLEGHQVDGIIVCGARLPSEELDQLLSRHQASVLVNRKTGSGAAVSMMVDDAHGVAEAVRHLLSRGHTRIGLLAGPDRSASAAARRHGYAQSLNAAGLPPDDSLMETCEPVEEAGYAGLKALVARRQDVTAVLAYNDLLAIGALQAAADLGLRVPEDLAVIGCDDVRLASLVTPALTTLRIDNYAIGRLSVEALLRMNRGQTARSVTFTPELVIRASAP